MSPELTFILMLALRMATAAAFVVSASFVAERAGPVIGALIATLPISAGPSYAFLALDHDAAFIAQGALASLPINAATIFLSLTYALLAQRHSLVVSCTAALAVWFGLAVAVRMTQWSLLGGLLVNAGAFAICVPLLARVRHVDKMPLITPRRYDIPLRASLVAILFPIVFTSLMLILHPRIGGRATAAVIANGAWGLMGFGLAIAVLHVGALHFGSAIALSLALATCVIWNLMLWWNGRRKAPAR